MALILNISEESFKEAKKIYSEELIPKIESDPLITEDFFSPANLHKRVFDLIEKLYISVVFAHTSVEAFINNLIPTNFIYEKEYTKSGITARLRCDKDWIEKNEALDDKIKKIIPQIYTLKSILTKYLSGKILKELCKYRDGIAHQKSGLANNFVPKHFKFIAELIHDTLKKDVIIYSGKELIKYISIRVQESKIANPNIPYEFSNRRPTIDEFTSF